MRKGIMGIVFILLGIACVGYGILVLGTNSGTGFFAVWFLIAALFFVLALFTFFGVWGRLPRGVRIAGVVILCLALAVFVCVEGRIATGFSGKGEKDLDYLIVLGAQVRTGGPSVVLKYRLDTACDYLTENPDTICIVSGGQGPNEPYPEAEGMKKYLTGKGIAPERILEEPESLNTKQNIDNSMKLIDPEKDRVGIVTNNFHVFRGVAIAKKAGIRNVSGIAAGSASLYLPNNMLREFFGVLKDAVSGNI